MAFFSPVLLKSAGKTVFDHLGDFIELISRFTPTIFYFAFFQVPFLRTLFAILFHGLQGSVLRVYIYFFLHDCSFISLVTA